VSDTQTPNLGLEYIDPSQSQPEVKINDAWNKIDAFAGETGSGGLTVKQVGDSPAGDAGGVRTIYIEGATVEQLTDGCLITFKGGGGRRTIALPGRPGDNGARGFPGRRGLNGAPGTAGAAGAAGRRGIGVRGRDGDIGARGFPGRRGLNGAIGATGAQQPPGAAWTSISYGAPIAVPVNAIPRLVTGTYTIKACIILTQGGPGSCVIDVWKLNLGTGYPPTSANDITGGSPPSISSGVSHNDTVLSGWTTGLVSDDVLLFTLASCSSFTFISIQLVIQ
jgi:hypothetical protein